MEQQQKSCSSVKIVEVCKITPNFPQSSQQDSLPITFFDIRWLRLPPVQRLFFYQTSAPQASFYSNILPRLKQSFSTTLRHYFPLAGALIWPETSLKPFISFSGSDFAGEVSFTVAESEGACNFFEISADFVAAEAFHPLVPNLADSDERAELFAIQVTLFTNVGFSIGIAAHHAVVDGKSSTSFMKSWAHICRFGDGALPPNLKPFIDRTVVEDDKNLAELYAEQWRGLDRGPNNRSVKSWHLGNVSHNSVRGTLRLSRDKVAKLRWLVNNDDQQIRFSTFCLAYAYMIICALKVEGISPTSDSTKIYSVLNFDCRARVEPTLAETYFGNCIGTSIVDVQEKGVLLGRHGLSIAARTFDVAVKGIDNEIHDKKRSWTVSLIENFVKKKRSETSKLFSVAGSAKFDVYGVDFGWGRPKKVDMVSIDKTGAFSFSDCRDGDGGVEIGLVLENHLMEAFAGVFAQGLE